MIQFSLRTSEKIRATKLREIEDVRWSARFAKAESEIGASDTASDGSTAANVNALSPHQEMRMVWNYVANADARNAENYKKDGPASDSEREELKTGLLVEMQAFESLDDPTSRQWAYSSSEKILVDNKLTLDDPAGIGLEFLDVVWRGLRELARRRLARLDGNYAPTVDPLFDPGKPPSPTVGELARELLDEKGEDAKINGGTKKSFEKHKASLALIVEILGDERPASSVGYDDCKMVRAALARVPTNRTKLFRGMTVKESIERAEVEGLPRLSPITQQTYLTALRELLELARMKGIVKANHAAGMEPRKRDAVAAGAPVNGAAQLAIAARDRRLGCGDANCPLGRPDEAGRGRVAPSRRLRGLQRRSSPPLQQREPARRLNWAGRRAGSRSAYRTAADRRSRPTEMICRPQPWRRTNRPRTPLCRIP